MTTTVGRREDKKLATRNLILGAAATLFPKVGYEQTSVDDIVKEADVVKGTFYYHFTSKEEVLMALRPSALCGCDVEQELGASGRSPLAVLADLLLQDARWTEENRALAEVYFTKVFAKATLAELPAGADGDSAVAEIIASDGGVGVSKRTGPPAAVVALVRAAQDAGELRRDQKAEDIAEVILGSFVHAQLSWLVTKSQDSLIERVERWLKIVLQGCAHECKADFAARY